MSAGLGRKELSPAKQLYKNMHNDTWIFAELKKVVEDFETAQTDREKRALIKRCNNLCRVGKAGRESSEEILGAQRV